MTFPKIFGQVSVNKDDFKIFFVGWTFDLKDLSFKVWG
jgi:hypothetical protein